MTLKPCDAQCSSATLTHARHFDIMPDQTAADSHSYTWAGAALSLPYIVKTHTAALCKSVWENNVNTGSVHRAKISPNSDDYFPSVSLLILSRFFFFFSHVTLPLLCPPLPPTHPSLHFWLSRMSRRQGHLTAVAVETKNQFFPPLSSPLLMYCKVMRYTEAWDKRSNDQEDMTKVKKIKAAAILVDVRLEKKKKALY